MSKRVLTAIAVCFVAASLPMAAEATPAAHLQKVRLAIGYIPHVQFTPLYVGMEKGFYREEGIELEISYGFQFDIFSLLAAGKVDVGLSDSDQLVLAGAKDMGLQVLYQYYQKYPVTIVAKKGTVKDPSDLKGKRIGTPEVSGTSYIGLELFMKKFGLQDAVHVEKIGYTQEAALESGRVDAVVCFLNNEPIVFRRKGVAILQWDIKDFSDMVGASFITSGAVIAERGNTLRGFVRATGKAMAFTIDHRDEAFRIALKAVGNIKKEDEPLFRERLDATCELFGHPKGYGFIDKGRYERSIAELAALGLISAPFPVERIVQSF